MMNRLTASALAIALTALGSAAIAASPADTIKSRQTNLKLLGKGLKTTMDQLKADSPDLAAIRAAAASIAATAPKIGPAFPVGTGPESRVKTGALPAIWQKPADFRAANDKFVAAARTLKVAADSGDLARIKASAQALGGTCKGCHDSFRQKD